MRRKGHRPAGRAAGWLGYGLVGAAAYLGGALVSEQKIGTDHGDREGWPEGFEAVLKETDLADNEMKSVEVAGMGVLLMRRNGSIHAIGNKCSHEGGPLSEGKYDGNCVVCPWHASRFALSTGAVVDGPATFPQPFFETRVRDGQIEIRLKS